MIAHLTGKILDKADQLVVIDVLGVGYEVFCSTRTLEVLGDGGAAISLYIYTHYKSEGAALFGFLSKMEKELFLSLIKVDSVGPKSALNILSAGEVEDLIDLIEGGDVVSLSKLPKVSKKTAEHLVVKLKGKLSAIAGIGAMAKDPGVVRKKSKILETHKMRGEAQTALVHLGFKAFESERVLSEMSDEIWQTDLESVIRTALNNLSGNV